jgi:hypothetical protein
MDPATKPVLAAALDQLWTRFLPQIRERVSILESAARSLAAGSLTAPEQEEAGGAAHKLAGVLGTFNLSRGTDLARQLEVFYTAEGAPNPIFAAQAASLASELRHIIETRG